MGDIGLTSPQMFCFCPASDPKPGIFENAHRNLFIQLHSLTHTRKPLTIICLWLLKMNRSSALLKCSWGNETRARFWAFKKTTKPLCAIHQPLLCVCFSFSIFFDGLYLYGLIMFLCLVETFLFILLPVNKWALWHTLVSLDSYIANQSSFSSINDKDLHYYKNLRNLWVGLLCWPRCVKMFMNYT